MNQRKRESLIFIRKNTDYLGRIVTDNGTAFGNFLRRLAKKSKLPHYYWVFTPQNYQRLNALEDSIQIVEGSSIYTAKDYRNLMSECLARKPGNLHLNKRDGLSGLEKAIYQRSGP